MIGCRLTCHDAHLNGINTLQGAKSVSTNQNQYISEFIEQKTVLFGCLVTCSSACVEYAGVPPKLPGCISFSAKLCYESQLQDTYNCSLQCAKSMVSGTTSFSSLTRLDFFFSEAFSFCISLTYLHVGFQCSSLVIKKASSTS